MIAFRPSCLYPQSSWPVVVVVVVVAVVVVGRYLVEEESFLSFVRNNQKSYKKKRGSSKKHVVFNVNIENDDTPLYLFCVCLVSEREDFVWRT